jgi:hypothetical protein
MYIAGCMQEQDPLDGAPGGDKDKYTNVVAEGLPHGGLRGDDETERRLVKLGRCAPSVRSCVIAMGCD